MNYPIMGGVMGLTPGSGQPHPHPTLFEAIELWAANARSALYLLLSHKQVHTLWLPSYLCQSLLDAVPSHCQTRFYPLDETLAPQELDWIRHIGPSDLIVVIDYFGFAPHPDLIAALMPYTPQIIEDASQAFLSRHIGRLGTYTLLSPRKFVGIPDGGLLTGWGHQLPLTSMPSPAWQAMLEAQLLRRAFDLGYGERLPWFKAFQKAESLQPIGPYQISGLSRHWLCHGLPYHDIAAQRRTNYEQLLSALKPLALFPHLPADVVPLGFPICLENREQIQQALFQADIFPAVHWPLPPPLKNSFEGSQRLAQRILTLPCDQRYNAKDMARLIQIILAWTA